MTAALRAKAPDARLMEGEFDLQIQDFKAIAEILYADSGIHLTDAKIPLVYSRLGKRLRALGMTRFRDYCELIATSAGSEERKAMLSALTTNVTRFFREPHHFDALKDQMDRLADRAKAGARLRLWSAGCSNGHEPYSMAMTLLDAIPDAARLDVRILATDIDPAVVARAMKGEYSAPDIEPIPASMKGRYVAKQGTGWKVKDEVQRLVAFRVLNLHADWPMKGRFDAIFCRNVAIYFDDVTQRRLWQRFGDKLTPEGRLYIGHSERADAPNLVSDGLTVYRRSGAHP